MNKLKMLLFVTTLVMTLAIVGCRTAPIYNVEQAPINVSANTGVSEIKKAILVAGASLGWQMKEVEPGHILGTLHLRKHMAQVDIPYSQTSYSIKYKDSMELDYDGSMIHKNYNGWIQNLDHAIQASLAGM
jgi:hypothetical protein